MKTLIKNILLVTHEGEWQGDIFIENGMIAQMGKDLSVPEGTEVISGDGKIAFPGLVDIHCHLRDPGQTYKEDIKSGSIAAAAGGFTSIVAMPNTKPIVDQASIVEYVNKKAKECAVVKVYQAGAISKGLKGEELAEMGEMKKAGIVAVTDDGRPVESSSLMRKALIYANMMSLPVISHAEDLDMADGGVMNEGIESTTMGLKGINRSAEENMVARDILLAKNTNTKVHITHISTAGSVNMIRTAKKAGIKVTSDTCPHYFSLTDEACRGFNTNAKMNPPLREASDVAEIIAGLRDGTIDAIATDHAPHHQDEKNCEFDRALNGIIGFETAFMLAYDILVKEYGFSLSQIISLMSKNPAELLNLKAGEIAIGTSADLVIASLDSPWVYTKENIQSKSTNSPFIGRTFYSKIENVFVDGKKVLQTKNLEV